MSREQVTVIIDSREASKSIEKMAAHLAVLDDVEDWYIDELDAGDLDIHGIGFERKTLGDYIKSLKEDRLTEQVMKLNQHYEHAYILVESNLVSTADLRRSDIASEAVRGSMASVTAREGIPVMCCSNRALLLDMAVRLARKHIEESSQSYLPKSEVENPDAPVAKKMYGCLPGIGPERAQTLYNHWPSIVEFVNGASRERIARLDGFGETTAKEVMEALL